MAAPYGRKSRTRSRMQRAANLRYAPRGFCNCHHCGEPKVPHHVCGSCGKYGQKQIIPVVSA